MTAITQPQPTSADVHAAGGRHLRSVPKLGRQPADPLFARLVDQLANSASLAGFGSVIELASADGHLTDRLVGLGVHVLALDSSEARLRRIDDSSGLLSRALWDFDRRVPAATIAHHDGLVSAFGIHRYPFSKQVAAIKHWTDHLQKGTVMLTGYGFGSAEDFHSAGQPNPLPIPPSHYLFGAELKRELAKLGVDSRWQPTTGNVGVLLAHRPVRSA